MAKNIQATRAATEIAATTQPRRQPRRLSTGVPTTSGQLAERSPLPAEQERPCRGPVQYRLEFDQPLTADELDVAIEAGFADPLDFAPDGDARYRQVTLGTNWDQ